MKRAVILLVIFSMIIGFGMVSDFNKVEANNNTIIFGDLDGDGQITGNDLFILRRHVNGIERITNDRRLRAADLNGDGKIDEADVELLRQYIAGIISSFPAATKPVLTISGTEFAPGQTFTLTFTDHSNTATPWFTIFNDKGQLIISGHRNRVYSDSFLAVGTYHAYAASQHGDSNWVTFTVKPVGGSAIDSGGNNNFNPIWPTDGGWISQGDFNSRGEKHSTRHTRAIDIAVSTGTRVYATESGTVTEVGDRGNTSFGKFIEIKHDNGAYSLYAHLSRQDVRVGQRVSRGQPIGLSGNSGGTTGAHLHFELSNSKQNRMADFFPGR